MEAREEMTIDLYKRARHFGRHEAQVPNSVQEGPPSPLRQAHSHPSFESSALAMPPFPLALPTARHWAGTSSSLATDSPPRAVVQH